jgi:hypothetical protein
MNKTTSTEDFSHASYTEWSLCLTLTFEPCFCFIVDLSVAPAKHNIVHFRTVERGEMVGGAILVSTCVNS